MKASELIYELQSLLEQYGDRDVWVSDGYSVTVVYPSDGYEDDEPTFEICDA